MTTLMLFLHTAKLAIDVLFIAVGGYCTAQWLGRRFGILGAISQFLLLTALAIASFFTPSHTL